MKKTIQKFLFVLTFCLVSLLSLSFLFSLGGCKLFTPSTGGKEEDNKPKIYFSVSEKTLTIGDEEYLTPIYDKMTGFTLTFESSNPTIVKVDNDGKISAEREGKATIKAIYASDSVRLEASLLVTSSFGGFLPELKTMGVSKNVAITVDGSYVILPYISFNGKEFNDATVTYSIVGDDKVAEISEDGEITAKTRGKTQVLVKASWRGKDHTNTPTLQKVIDLSVIDDVRFYNDGEPIIDEKLYTLAEFEGVAYKNAIPCDFTVNVNGESETATVTVQDEGVVSLQGDELVAVGFGETYVLVQKQKDDITYSTKFKIVVERIEKEITDVVPLFGTLDGTYLNVATGEKKKVLAFIGETDQIVDAYQNGKALRVENGKIFGVESSSATERGEAQIEVGTDTLMYQFRLETLAKAITTVEDLKVLELSDGKIVSGYFELINDINASSLTFNHVVTNDAKFNGVFNGNGHVVSNLTLNENSSMFGVLQGTATVKNFALVNLTATKSYFLAQNTTDDGLTIKDVYISLTPETKTPRGLTGRTGSNSVVQNVVIEYLGANAEQNRNYQERWTWQGLIGGMWTYTSDGKYYAQDNKWENVYVVSPFVVSFRSDEKKDSADPNKYAAIYGYGANETEDIYGNSLNGSVYNRDNPNLGDCFQTTEYYNAIYRNLYHYNSYSALKSANADYSSFDSKYWVEYDGRIAWKSLAVSQIAVNIYDGDKTYTENTKIKTTDKQLTIKAFIGESEISLSSVSVESNSYVTWNSSRKVLSVNSLPETGDVKVKITVSVNVGDVTVTKELYVTVSSLVVDPIQPGGDYNGDDYENSGENRVEPIKPGGDFDGGEYGD